MSPGTYYSDRGEADKQFDNCRPSLRDTSELDFEVKEFAAGVMATFAQREGVNGGVNGLLAYIQSHPRQRASEMATAFDLSQRTIERWLKQLKDNQLIECRGAPKTGSYYPLGH